MIDLREYVRELHMKSINKTPKSTTSRQLKMIMKGGGSIAPSSEWGGGNGLNDFMNDNKSRASKVSKLLVSNVCSMM